VGGCWLTEVQTEDIHALTNELVNGVEVVPGVRRVVGTGVVLLTELSTRLVDAEPFQLLGLTLLCGSSEGGADQSGRRKDVLEKHNDCC
jgi:hypothetical protein